MKRDLERYVTELKQGNASAFRSIYDLYHKKIGSFCLNNGQCPEDAQEVVQEIFVRLWVNRNDINLNKNFESYLFSMAKHLIIDKFRKLVRERAARKYQIYTLTPNNTTENEVIYNDLQEKVRETIASLPEMRRLVFYMSRVEERSNKEIASELGMSVKTVENHISRALKLFYEKFGYLKAISLLLPLYVIVAT